MSLRKVELQNGQIGLGSHLLRELSSLLSSPV